MNFLAFGDRAGRHMYGRGDFFPIGALVGMLLLAGLVAAIVVLATRSSRRHAPGAAFTPSPPVSSVGFAPTTADDALNLARLRYARGEMNRDDYLQTAADLGGAIMPAPPMAATTSPPTVTPPTDG